VKREYGAAGLVAILPPQANTTVEAELAVLLEPDVAAVVSRLTCFDDDSRARLLGYFHNVGSAVRAFDAARPQLGLFACTGSSYLVGLEEESRAFARLPFPVLSAAGAVLAALDALHARRIALVSPYPPWLTEACVAFWRSRGRDIGEVRTPEGERTDTRRIYDLGSAHALAEVRALARSSVDCIVISGTGMPSLAALAHAPAGPPIVSSNLCLAWAAACRLAARACDGASLQAWLAPDARWRARLASRFPHTLENSE
jgi:maleate isomerase